MDNRQKKRRIKIILKLLVVIPLFYCCGRYVGNDIIEGNYMSLLVLTVIWNIAGFILYKI